MRYGVALHNHPHPRATHFSMNLRRRRQFPRSIGAAKLHESAESIGAPLASALQSVGAGLVALRLWVDSCSPRMAL